MHTVSEFLLDIEYKKIDTFRRNSLHTVVQQFSDEFHQHVYNDINVRCVTQN